MLIFGMQLSLRRLSGSGRFQVVRGLRGLDVSDLFFVVVFVAVRVMVYQTMAVRAVSVMGMDRCVDVDDDHGVVEWMVVFAKYVLVMVVADDGSRCDSRGGSLLV